MKRRVPMFLLFFVMACILVFGLVVASQAADTWAELEIGANAERYRPYVDASLHCQFWIIHSHVGMILQVEHLGGHFPLPLSYSPYEATYYVSIDTEIEEGISMGYYHQCTHAVDPNPLFRQLPNQTLVYIRFRI